MKFIYLRLFLSKVATTDSLFGDDEEYKGLSREQYLKLVFSYRIDFEHRNNKFVFIPISREAGESENYIFGRVGKQYKIVDNKGPDQDLEDGEDLRWIASYFVLNTSSDSDGQKIAIQDRVKVGRPLAYVSSLIQQINLKSALSGWYISVNPMVDESSFWEVVKANKGSITKAEFRYITPNVLGLRSLLNERLREYRDKQNAQEVSVTLTEPKGDLNLETEDVSDSIEYISEGGGSAKLSSGKKVLFDSRNAAKIRETDIENDASFHTVSGREELISRVLGDD
jgi:hypothetical protein